MTDDKREFYDKQYMWARLSMSQDDFEAWSYEVSWPCCAEKPDGIFDSVKEYREFFYFD
jgi:hypothetical protein